MSYSFSFRAVDKAEARVKVAAEFEKIAANQLCHERDKAQSIAVAEAFLALLDDEAPTNGPTGTARKIAVAMNGHLSGTWAGSDIVSISGAACTVNVAYVWE